MKRTVLALSLAAGLLGSMFSRTVEAEIPEKERLTILLEGSDPTSACFDAGGIVVESHELNSEDCGSPGVLDPKCGDWCEAPDQVIEQDADWDWDAFGGDSVDDSIQRADYFRTRLMAESAMKVANRDALRERLRSRSLRVAALADQQLAHARTLQKQKDGPSAKALRAYKSAWKAVSKTAKQLLDETEE